MIPDEDGGASPGAPFMADMDQRRKTSSKMPIGAVGGAHAARGQKSHKKSNRMIVFGMLCLTVAALSGIGFGVWAIMDGNAKVKTMSNDNNILQQKNTELSKKLNEANAKLAELENQAAAPDDTTDDGGEDAVDDSLDTEIDEPSVGSTAKRRKK